LRLKLTISAAVAAALLIAGVAGASVYEVGDQGTFTTPPCVDSNCQVVTKVSAYQQQIADKKNPFRITRTGKVVALTLYLPDVGKKPLAFFQSKYGGAPTAKISILRPRPRRGVPYRYVLASQGAPIDLSEYLNGTPTFVLNQPLTVKKNDVVAVTTDSWLPAFAVAGQDSRSTWRASRPAKTCKDLATQRMHEKVGQIKQYACAYTGARLLYKAVVIDTPKKTSPKTTSPTK